MSRALAGLGLAAAAGLVWWHWRYPGATVYPDRPLPDLEAGPAEWGAPEPGQSVEGVDVENRKPVLVYFEPSEFGIWWPFMADDLLHKLDDFRARWGAPVVVSRASGALGRHDGTGESQHNVDAWGEVRAVDVFPMIDGGYIHNEAQRYRAFKIAKEVGFTGIGLYTDTRPGNMVHLDVRKTRNPGYPAKWSRVAGNYGALEAVI
jgi:hypothetical protein